MLHAASPRPQDRQAWATGFCKIINASSGKKYHELASSIYLINSIINLYLIFLINIQIYNVMGLNFIRGKQIEETHAGGGRWGR